MIHEVLLVDDEKQAYARCIGANLNRGREAARAATAGVLAARREEVQRRGRKEDAS